MFIFFRLLCLIVLCRIVDWFCILVAERAEDLRVRRYEREEAPSVGIGP